MPETKLSRITLFRFPVAVLAISILLASGVFSNQGALTNRPVLKSVASQGIFYRHLSHTPAGRVVQLEVSGTKELEVGPWMSEIKKEIRMGASQVDLRVFSSSDWAYQGLVRVAKKPRGPDWIPIDKDLFCQIERHALYF